MEQMNLDTEQYYGYIRPTLQEKLKGRPAVYRLTGARERFYFTRPNPNEDCIIYNSGTTLIRNYRDMDGEAALERYRIGLINQGKDPDKVLSMRQDYGTIMHIIYGQLISGNAVPLDNLIDFTCGLEMDLKMSQNRIEEVVSLNEYELKKDIISLLQWIKDYKVEPIGIELMMVNEKWKVATPIDLLCDLEEDVTGYWGVLYKSGAKKGEPRETKKKVKIRGAVVDFKSGKKGFWPKNVLQLLLSKEIVEEYLGYSPSIYNFAPNDWNRTPSYKFYNQERETKNIDFLKRISSNVFERGRYEFEEKIAKKKSMVISGVADLDSDVIVPKFLSNVELANMRYDKHHVNTSSSIKEILRKQTFLSLDDFILHISDYSDTQLQELAENSRLGYAGRSNFIEKIKTNLAWQI